MIDQLITALSKEIEMSAEEIADTIWLALQMQEFHAESVSSGLSRKTEKERGNKNEKIKPEQETSQKPEPKSSDLEETSIQPSKEQKRVFTPKVDKKTQTLRIYPLKFLMLFLYVNL